MTIYSIGYGVTRTLPTLIEQLKKRGIQKLIDCRTHPVSRYNPAFSRISLQTALENAGITYIHNRALGGKQEFGEQYAQALNDLTKSFSGKTPPAVLLCSELDPRKCHRYQRIGEDLAQKGLYIVHIDKDDSNWRHPITAKKAPKKSVILHR